VAGKDRGHQMAVSMMVEPNETRQASPTTDAELATEAFIGQLGRSHRQLYLYVMSLVPNRSDAEDILQQTNLVLWREFERFQPGTNFTAWACSVAFNQVLAWRKRRQRDRLVFSEAFLQAVAEEASAEAERLEERSLQLAGCIDKLPPHHRELIRLRYREGNAVEAIAGRLNRTVDAVYRMLSRIRQSLQECVTRSLGQEGAV
jgi:RNA polymerase sigma-70 factor (ECF subfamily)